MGKDAKREVAGDTRGTLRSWIATAVVVALLAIVVVLGARLTNLALGVLQIPERAFLRSWSTAGARIEESAESGHANASRLQAAIAAAATTRASEDTIYDPAYVSMQYPGGDVSPDRGVCTDLVVRALRDVGVDLQEAVHVDMSLAFEEYPTIWGSSEPDSNIDHRRVPNLMVFFDRSGYSLPITTDSRDYMQGDIVAWHLGRGMTHIGIVSDEADDASGRPLVAHHIGGRPAIDDVLFDWDVVGHFRYYGQAIE